MIDLNTNPDPSGVLIEALPRFVLDAVKADFSTQRDAVSSLRDIERLGVDHLHFVNMLREIWLTQDTDECHAEFNSLLFFLSSIAKCCSDTASLVEQDRE